MKVFAPVFLLLLFTLSPLVETAAASIVQIGYIPVESLKKGKRISQKLLKNKLATSAVVVPVLPEDPKNPKPKATKASSPTHLLIIETSAALISKVKSAIAKAFKGSSSPQVDFVPAISTPPYLGATLPTAAPLTSSVYLDGEHEVRIKAVVGELIVFQVKGDLRPGYMWRIDNSISDLKLRFHAVIKGSLMPGDPMFTLKVEPKEVGLHVIDVSYYRIANPTDNPVQRKIYLDTDPVAPSVHLDGEPEVRIDVVVGDLFVFQVKGDPKPGYKWRVTSPSFSKFVFHTIEAKTDGLMPGGAIFTLKGESKKAGLHVLDVFYVRASDPTDNPVHKKIYLNVATK